MEPGDDPYAVLNVDSSATPKQIRAAYRKQALKHHPDKHPDNRAAATERFSRIGAAYELLSDVGQRAEYEQRTAATTQFHDPFDIFESVFRHEFGHTLARFEDRMSNPLGRRERDPFGWSSRESRDPFASEFFRSPYGNSFFGGGSPFSTRFGNPFDRYEKSMDFRGFGEGKESDLTGNSSSSFYSSRTVYRNGESVTETTRRVDGKEVNETIKRKADGSIERNVEGDEKLLDDMSPKHLAWKKDSHE